MDAAIPQDALARVAEVTGLSAPREFSVNTGVALFNNLFCEEIAFYETLFRVIEALTEKCPSLRTLEQAAVALVISNYLDGYHHLKKEFHQRVITTASGEKFSPNAKIIHYLTAHKPWLPFDDTALNELARRGSTFLPFYRNIWFEFARTVDGFDAFCKAKPFSAMELAGIGSAALLADREHSKKRNDAGIFKNDRLVRDIVVHRRRQLSEKIGKDFGWTVKYGPFTGLKLSEKTWWSRPSRGAMFLGVYEKEVLDLLVELSQAYDNFVDIGSADGYYAVGVLHANLFHGTHAFEISEKGQDAIKRNADLNGVSSRIKVFGKANVDFYKTIGTSVAKNSVVMVDVEGAEFDILNSDVFANFDTSAFIVEIHDWLVDNGREKLEKLKAAASKTHRLVEYTMSSRDSRNSKSLSIGATVTAGCYVLKGARD